MNKLVIFGSGGHAKIIFSEIIKLKKFKLLGFVDDFKKKGELIINFNKKKYYNLGSIKQVINKKSKFSGIVGVNLNFVRKKIVNDIKNINKDFKFQKIISKNAYIGPNVIIGEGTLVVSGSTINIGTKIGKHCILNTSSSIDHDNRFNDFSGTGPGVVTGGNVVVGEKSYIGMGSIIKNNINISNDTIVGFSSLVNKDCDRNSVYWGSPAKKKRARKYNENYL